MTPGALRGHGPGHTPASSEEHALNPPPRAQRPDGALTGRTSPHTVQAVGPRTQECVCTVETSTHPGGQMHTRARAQ